MDMSVVYNVENKERPKWKVISVKPIEGNPNSALSITLNNIVYLEDVGSYLNNNFESIGSEYMNKDMELVFNHDMTMKPRFEHLKELDLFKYHFYQELDTEEWTHIIISRIHDGKLWMENSVVNISANLIHEVASLIKQGSVPIGEKLVNKKVEIYKKVVYNRKAIVIITIKQDGVRFFSRIIAYSICASSKIDELLAKFIYAAYKICVEKEKVNLSEILRMRLLENLEKIKRTKNLVCLDFSH